LAAGGYVLVPSASWQGDVKLWYRSDGEEKSSRLNGYPFIRKLSASDLRVEDFPGSDIDRVGSLMSKTTWPTLEVSKKVFQYHQGSSFGLSYSLRSARWRCLRHRVPIFSTCAPRRARQASLAGSAVWRRKRKTRLGSHPGSWSG
jgi:hypothetical protein